MQAVPALLAPGLIVILVFAAALSALLRYSLLGFVPGSLQTGGTVTLAPGQALRLHLPADAFTRLHAAVPEADR